MEYKKTRKCAVCNERIYPDRKHCIRHVPFKFQKSRELPPTEYIIIGKALYGDTDVFLMG